VLTDRSVSVFIYVRSGFRFLVCVCVCVCVCVGAECVRACGEIFGVINIEGNVSV